MSAAPSETTVVAVLPVAPTAALATLEALADLTERPRHDVVLVDVSGGALDELLRRVDGDIDIVRADRRSRVAGALPGALARVVTPTVAVLPEGGCVAPGFLAALDEALASDPSLALAAAVAAEDREVPPVAGPAFAARTGALRDAAEAGLLRAPDGHVVAAACAALAPAGAVRSVPGAVVSRPGTRAAAARGGWKYGGEPELTIVVPTLDAAGERLRGCVRALQDHTDAAHEIVVVDNGAPPQGFTAPVNAGIRAARGRFVVVCNDDVEVLPGWWPPLREALTDPAEPAAVAFPLTVDGAMREDFAAWCFALRADTIERHGVAAGEFLDPRLRVWYQDTDLLVRLRAAGTPPRLVRTSRVRHGLSETVGTADPSLRAWIDAQIRRDKATFEALHGDGIAGAAR